MSKSPIETFTYSLNSLSFELQRSQTTHLVSVFLSCEAYYIEVCIEENGLVQSVRLGQGARQEVLVQAHLCFLMIIFYLLKESGTLTNLLRSYKYALFDRHLKALADMYSQAPR